MRQGVTTEIIGHCGFSVAPALPGKFALLKNYLSPSAPWLPFKEMSFPQYLGTFPATSVNAGVLVDHNTLRLMVTGIENERGRSAAAGRIRFGWLEPATTRRIKHWFCTRFVHRSTNLSEIQSLLTL